MSVSLLPAARKSGVTPTLSATFTSAPASMRRRTIAGPGSKMPTDACPIGNVERDAERTTAIEGDGAA